MGRISTKENKTVYQLARDNLELSREKASELTGIEPYRIERIEEAYDFGYEEYFYSGDLCLVEWPEKIEGLLPEDTMQVRITADGEEERTIEID